jgi:hypothetical protein
MTKKINNVKPVHISFWLKGTFVSGCCTSGRIGEKGLMRSRNRTVQSEHAQSQPSCSWGAQWQIGSGAGNGKEELTATHPGGIVSENLTDVEEGKGA